MPRSGHEVRGTKMGKLLYTDNIGFSMNDWETESIRKVFAGTGCIMAITDDGRVMQKIVDKDIAARTQYWTRIQQIALSKWAAGVAIGLVSDGTCMISKRPIRAGVYSGRNFEWVNDTVKSWHDIVQVAASDSFFALDSTGNVHYAYFSYRREYEDNYRSVTSWRNVCKIVTGSQDSVFGVTTDGRVLCAGAGCMRGPYGNLQRKLDLITDAVDVYPTGAECQVIVIAKSDGSLVDHDGRVLTYSKENEEAPLPIVKMPEGPLDQVLDGTFWYTVVGRTPGGALFSTMRRYVTDWENSKSIFPSHVRINSFAVGDIGYGTPFVIAVAE